MLGLPSSAAYELRVPKSRFIEPLPARSKIKRMITEQVDSIYWRYSLSPKSIRLPEGRTVQEIDVFEITARTPSLSPEVLRAIDGVISRPIIFLVASPAGRSLVMCYKETKTRPNRPQKIDVGDYFSTPIPDVDAPVLQIEGLDLDALRDAFLRQIAGDALPFPREWPIQDVLRRGKERDALLKKIAALENKIRREKQFNRQVELRVEMKEFEIALNRLSSTSNE